jgi:hypothetical protein
MKLHRVPSTQKGQACYSKQHLKLWFALSKQLYNAMSFHRTTVLFLSGSMSGPAQITPDVKAIVLSVSLDINA